MAPVAWGKDKKDTVLSARINKWLCDIQITASESLVFFGEVGEVKSALFLNKIFLTLIIVVLLLIPPCSQSGFRRTDGEWKIDSAYCIVGGKWRSGLTADFIHLPSLPLISTQQQLASHLVTRKWYSVGSVWEEMAGYEAWRSRGCATDKSC